MPKNMSPEGLTAPRNFEMDQMVKVGSLDSIAEGLSDRLQQYLLALTEHWSDDEGLHRYPFERELEKELGDVVRKALIDECLSQM